MKLRFLGTRGEIERRSPRYRRHSSLLVTYRRRSLLIDCGLDWLGQLASEADALLLDHAHAPGPRRRATGRLLAGVYATEETWSTIARYPLPDRRIVSHRRPQQISAMAVEAFPLEHTLRAPAVGYRIAAGRGTIFYAPDVVSIQGRGDALTGLDLYVGDGAAIARSCDAATAPRIGNASIRAQIEWCAEEGVERTIFTHCGAEIVRADERTVAAKVEALGQERGIRASIAYDGLDVRLP